MKKRFISLGILLALMLTMCFSMAGCGNSDSSSTPGSGEEASKNSELVVVTSSEPVYFNNLCPSMTNLPDTLVYSQVYDPLFYKDWNDGGKVKGYLAESYEISEDGLDISIKLRDNVYFHNGDKLTSEDVKFTFDEMYTRTLGTALLINWDSVEIVDELNLIFHLKAPYGAIMNALCSRLNYISARITGRGGRL